MASTKSGHNIVSRHNKSVPLSCLHMLHFPVLCVCSDLSSVRHRRVAEDAVDKVWPEGLRVSPEGREELNTFTFRELPDKCTAPLSCTKGRVRRNTRDDCAQSWFIIVRKSMNCLEARRTEASQEKLRKKPLPIWSIMTIGPGKYNRERTASGITASGKLDSHVQKLQRVQSLTPYPKLAQKGLNTWT